MYFDTITLVKCKHSIFEAHNQNCRREEGEEEEEKKGGGGEIKGVCK